MCRLTNVARFATTAAKVTGVLLLCGVLVCWCAGSEGLWVQLTPFAGRQPGFDVRLDVSLFTPTNCRHALSAAERVSLPLSIVCRRALCAVVPVCWSCLFVHGDASTGPHKHTLGVVSAQQLA